MEIKPFMFLNNLEALFEEFHKERKFLKNIARKPELYYRQSFTAFKKYSSKPENPEIQTLK